jgi:hypothetical protein
MRDKVKLSPPSSSESWRKVYERMGFPSLLGQLQHDAGSFYGIRGPTADVDDETSNVIGLSTDRDDLKGAWRSVLACGKSMEQQLDGDTSGSKKPLLSTVVSFISNAYGLPTPESCFGTQHVIIEEVSYCLLTILEHIEKTRHIQAKLRDMLFNESGEGIDADALQKFLDVEGKMLPVKLDEADELYKFMAIVSEWEGRLSFVLEPKDDCSKSENRDDLLMVENLATEARAHGYISKGLVQLGSRIQKAHHLRGRVMQWKAACQKKEKGAVKAVTVLVRDASRLKLIFPEVTELLKFQRTMESWVDRANIAIRSRISLMEIKGLITRGEEMPLDLSDFLEKLKARVRIAEEWVNCLEDVIPRPVTEGKPEILQWMDGMRTGLKQGQYGRLHDLASEGSRIPVEVDAVKLLQVELDAKNWTTKAKRWIPGHSDGKRGKLMDIRDHIEKAVVLRDKLALSDSEKYAWVLEGEAELISVVRAADAWFDQVSLLLPLSFHVALLM